MCVCVYVEKVREIERDEELSLVIIINFGGLLFYIRYHSSMISLLYAFVRVLKFVLTIPALYYKNRRILKYSK